MSLSSRFRNSIFDQNVPRPLIGQDVRQTDRHKWKETDRRKTSRQEQLLNQKQM